MESIIREAPVVGAAVVVEEAVGVVTASQATMSRESVKVPEIITITVQKLGLIVVAVVGAVAEEVAGVDVPIRTLGILTVDAGAGVVADRSPTIGTSITAAFTPATTIPQVP